MFCQVTRKEEAAEVQLKRKVKALEMKCAELQQRAKAAEEANITIAQERFERERELTSKLTLSSCLFQAKIPILGE